MLAKMMQILSRFLPFLATGFSHGNTQQNALRLPTFLRRASHRMGG
jgi:hypothetical protein